MFGDAGVAESEYDPLVRLTCPGNIADRFIPEFGDRTGIPLGAEVIAVAYSYYSMTTDRPYRAGREPWQAYAELEKESGKQFHPDVVKAFKEVLMTKVEPSMEEAAVA